MLRVFSLHVFFVVFSSAAACLLCACGSPPPAPPTLSQMAMAAHAPAFSDALSVSVRTAPPSYVRFRDAAAQAGLNYEWKIAGKRPLNILQTIGNGCAFLDYDNDGCLDILLVGEHPALFRGDGHGHFTNVTAAVGLDKLHGHFLGCAVGDIDNDGYADVYLSGYGTGVLLHNERGLTPQPPSRIRSQARREGGESNVHKSPPFPNEARVDMGRRKTRSVAPSSGGPGGLGRHFRDITKIAGLKPQPWGTSCGFADLDGDGFLDLYVANYVAFGPDTKPQLCPDNGVMSSCGPHYYRALHGVVYGSRGGHSFEDVTQAWGAGHQSGNSLGVAFADFEGTGRVGFAVANDELGGDLFANQGPGKLVNINASSGTATDRAGKGHAGMGMDWGDYDNDGKPDLFVTTFTREAKCLYHNEGEGLFREQSDVTGIEAAALMNLGFGCKFLDADNDGWLDLLLANGHVQDNIAQVNGTPYRQNVQFLHNGGGPNVVYQDDSASAGLKTLPALVGRGLAVGDYDNDGRMDALVVDSEGRPLLLHNETESRNSSSGAGRHSALSGRNHWIGFKLHGAGRSNRDAYGAQVTVFVAGGQRMRQCHPGGSYLSSSDVRVHFGLAQAARVQSVVVRWPDGKTQTWPALAVDRYHTLQERIER